MTITNIAATGRREVAVYKASPMRRKEVREESCSCLKCGTYWKYYGETLCPFCHAPVDTTRPVTRIVPGKSEFNPRVKLWLLLEEKKLEMAEHQNRMDNALNQTIGKVVSRNSFTMSELQEAASKAAAIMSFHKGKINFITNIISELERKLK